MLKAGCVGVEATRRTHQTTMAAAHVASRARCRTRKCERCRIPIVERGAASRDQSFEYQA